MSQVKQSVFTALLFAFIIFASSGELRAAGFDQFIGFGDSTLDTGYFRYHSTGNPALDHALAAAIAHGATGGFAGNGEMGTTMLAGRFGLSASPIGGGGMNYAVGGALTAADRPPTVSVVRQIWNYLASVNGVANPHALYIISSGNNDLTHASHSPDFLHEQASALAAAVAALQAAGARNIMVPNSYNSAVFAGLGGDIDKNKAGLYARSVSYGLERWSSLTAAGVHFIPVDLDNVFKYVVQHPTLFGFTASSVLASSSPSSVSALLSILTTAQQQTYLFIDGKHLTTAGHMIEADYEYSLLTAPSQISLIAETAVQGGLSRTATIQRQVEISGQDRGASGIKGWAAAGVSHIDINNASGFPGDSGTPFLGSVGVDYLTSIGVIIGGALSAGSQSQSFSTGGAFDQDTEAVSLYAAYNAGQVWSNAVVTYGFLQNSISRSVKLGIFTDRNHGDTSGQTLALALRGGVNFKSGQFTTGPLAGVVLQQVRLNDFTETGTTGTTALAFDSRTRDSQITQLGWRGSMDLGDWQPFAEAAWNHEWRDESSDVTASLTSVSAPSFSASAVPIASDWGTASLGASYKINPQMLLWTALSGVFANSEMTTYGVELGLSVSF